jgi:hypothetical protein
MADRKPNILIL